MANFFILNIAGSRILVKKNHIVAAAIALLVIIALLYMLIPSPAGENILMSLFPFLDGILDLASLALVVH